MTTMNERYGDGSDHIVCDGCGCCETCGDCICGLTTEGDTKAFKDFIDGESIGVKEEDFEVYYPDLEATKG